MKCEIKNQSKLKRENGEGKYEETIYEFFNILLKDSMVNFLRIYNISIRM